MALKEKKPGKTLIKRYLASYNSPYSDIAEQFREIRNNIRFAGGGQIRSIVVTSPSVGDGKSTAAVNLAICLSQRGDRVLLIDANLRQPLLNYLFDTPMSPGLTEVLTHQAELAEAIKETEIERLSLLTGGSALYSSVDLIDSKDMYSALEQVKELFDVIVLDCPAVLETSNACVLASKCDGTILILKGGKTHRDKALQAKRILELGKVNLIGAVLNKSKKRS